MSPVLKTDELLRSRSTRIAGRAAALCLAGSLLIAPVIGSAATLQLDLGRLVHPTATVEGLRVEMGAEGTPAKVVAAQVVSGERRWRDVELRCPRLLLEEGRLACQAGTLSAPGFLDKAEVDLHADFARNSTELSLRPGAGERLTASLAADGRLELGLEGLAVGRVAAWLPDLAAWHPSGRIYARLDYRPGSAQRVVASARIAEGGFATADGLRAAEGLAFELNLDAVSRDGGWDWRGHARWSAGEAYLHPLYLQSGAALEAEGYVAPDRLLVTSAILGMEGVRSIAANGEVDLARGDLRRAALSVAEADLAVVGSRYLAPVLAPAKAEQLRFAGRLSAGIEVGEEGLLALDVAFDEAGFALADGGLSFGPMSGGLPWRADRATEAHLSVGGGRWQKLALGPFELAARLQGHAVEVARLSIPVLDGALVLNDLRLKRDAAGWTGQGGAVVEPISMPLLTEAVGLPAMSGVLSASLPGLRVAPGELVLDGALVISVFDGYLQATNLRVLEPFGVASHLYADVEARHLDLAQLTETFSFGSITGFMDADVRGLELARWRPVRFNARLASSPGDYPRRISQRAVQNIGALGGAGAVVAIQRSFLGFFETFGYREIGLSCVLADGVCSMGGLGGEEAGAPGGGYYIVRGGGIPALNVIGYNRRVDWTELVDRLLAVIQSNTGPIIR